MEIGVMARRLMDRKYLFIVYHDVLYVVRSVTTVFQQCRAIVPNYAYDLIRAYTVQLDTCCSGGKPDSLFNVPSRMSARTLLATVANGSVSTSAGLFLDSLSTESIYKVSRHVIS